MSDAVVDPALRRVLGALPEFTPREDLWERIQGERTRRQRRQRRVSWMTAASVLLTLGFGLGWSVRPPTPVEAPASTWIARAQALETALAALPADAGGPGTVALEAELARVDAALQAAYDRRAPTPELEALWRSRGDLLEALLAASRASETVLRI